MDTSNHTKRCKYCQRDLALTEFHVRKASPDGLCYKCKECNVQQAKAYAQNNPDRVREQQRQRYAQRKADGREDAYRAANAERIAEKKREWRKANPDKVREQKRRSYQRNRETNNERVRRWMKAHPEQVKAYSRKYYENNIDRVRESRKRYLETHPEVKKAMWKRGNVVRKARIRGASGSHTSEDLRLIQLAQTDRKGRVRCWWCGDPMTDWHVDHKLPLSRGGTNDASNLCLACAPCNLRKNAKTPDEFNGRLL